MCILIPGEDRKRLDEWWEQRFIGQHSPLGRRVRATIRMLPSQVKGSRDADGLNLATRGLRIVTDSANAAWLLGPGFVRINHVRAVMKNSATVGFLTRITNENGPF
jgi:hypothetical protein